MRTRSPETQNRHLRRDLRELRAQVSAVWEELRQRRLYGAMLANVCCNLAQDTALPIRYRQSMDRARRDWDAIPRAPQP